jgi:hypothetical protein
MGPTRDAIEILLECVEVCDFQEHVLLVLRSVAIVP